jgi:hypothetical protein
MIALPPERQEGERRVAKILQFVRPTESLDPELLKILGAAYDQAILTAPNRPETVYSLMASRLIEAGTFGERNPTALQEIALRGVL